ncbi:hypothetical protein [Thiomonas sp.]
MGKRSAVLAAVLLAGLPLAASAGTLRSAMNSVGVYGEGQGFSSQYSGGPDAGLGLRGTTLQGNWFGTAGVHYDFGGYGTPTPSGGHVWGVGVKAGYLIPLGGHFRVGPYLGYDHLQFHEEFFGGAAHIGSENDALGGGLYAAWAPVSRLSIQVYAGYLGGINASGDVNGTAVHVRSSNVVQVGALTDYRLTGPVHLFAAFRYNHLNGDFKGNQYRWLAGAAYSFG